MDIIQNICTRLGISKNELMLFCDNAPKKYKVYTIPKRTMGNRLIAQPSKALKEFQRAIVAELEPVLPIHSSAYAYRKGLGIKHNALQHVKYNYLLKMDFHNFFNKIKPDVFFGYLENNGFNLSYTERYILEQLLFWKPGLKRSKTLVLSVGAPSSPFITNFVMYQFDVKISKWCDNNSVVYTRYADDISFSTNKKGVLFSVPTIVKGTLRDTVPGLGINELKTIYTSKQYNRHVTGVTLTSDNKLSLGRVKKRYISSLIHKFLIKQLPIDELPFLQGMIAHAKNIEPIFITRMKKKYGRDVIKEIIKG